MKMERRSPRAVCLFRRTERKKERANRFKRVQKNHNDQGSQKKKKRSRPRLGEAAALLRLQAGGRRIPLPVPKPALAPGTEGEGVC